MAKVKYNNIGELKTVRATRLNKYFVKPTSKTMTLKQTSLTTVVGEIYKVNTTQANKLIINGDVSVNGIIVTLLTYVLQVGDIVRIGEGHIVESTNFMAIIVAV